MSECDTESQPETHIGPESGSDRLKSSLTNLPGPLSWWMCHHCDVMQYAFALSCCWMCGSSGRMEESRSPRLMSPGHYQADLEEAS